MQDANYNFKELVHECCKQGFRCDNVGAILSLLGGLNATARMISINRENSVTDNYTAILTHLLCACFNTVCEGGASGHALGATLTSMTSAYWKFIVGDTNWGKIQTNIATDAKNALELFEKKYKDQYDDEGYVNYVPAYLAMVKDNSNKVYGPTKAARFFDKDNNEGERKFFISYDDGAQKKKFKSFVNSINSHENYYQHQRKELCSQSSVVKAYFVAANKKHAAKHTDTNTQPRFDII
jgi:hypothetical protein